MVEKIFKNLIYYLLLLTVVIVAIVYISGRIRSWIVFDNYRQTEFGIVGNEFKIEYKGRFVWSSIKGVHGDRWRWWVSAYEVSVPFMDKPFEVWVDKRNYQIFGDNFYEVLSRDNKFQHLYSEWVKKQVGIDDEDVEFGFTGNFDKPYIDFDKITSLSDDYREVFENIHNLYAKYCSVKNMQGINVNNKFQIASNIRIDYLSKAMVITSVPQNRKDSFTGRIELSSGNFNKSNDVNYEFRYDARIENSPLEELDY